MDDNWLALGDNVTRDYQLIKLILVDNMVKSENVQVPNRSSLKKEVLWNKETNCRRHNIFLMTNSLLQNTAF